MAERPGNMPIVVGLSGNVIDSALQSGGFDGIGVYTAALEGALRAAGVGTRRVGSASLVGLRLRMPADADVRLRVPLVPAIAWSALTGMAAPFSRALEGAIDVYHCTDYRTPRLSRTPVVTTLYDAIPFAHPEWGNPRLRGVKNWLLRTAAANAARVIAISAAAVDELVEHYRVERARVRVVHLGVAAHWFDTPSERAQEQAGRLDLAPGYFLFVGTLQPRKNVAALLEAYDRLPAAVQAAHQLVIVGRYGWGVPEVRDALRARRAGKRVVWLDYVDREVLHAVYRNAGAFVFPSLAEGFGLPVLEALASGLPVVASDLPVVREVAGDHALLCRATDVDALGNAMNEALGVARSAAADARRQAWARRFDWLTCAARTIEVYREVLGR